MCISAVIFHVSSIFLFCFVACRPILDECQFSSARSQAFLTAFLQRKPALRTLLSKTAFSFAHIVDVSWRVDYYIKSNLQEKIGAPVYFISLKLLPPDQDEIQTLQFTASLQELQDLVSKLQEACKQVERLYTRTTV